MTRAAVVVRPEPGNAATARRLAALGLTVRRLPLFAVEPVAWTAPDPAAFDALLLTSANAARHAGPAIAALAGMPVVAVGEATAAAARAAGLVVVATGDADVAAAVALARGHGFGRLLHLAGQDRVAIDGIAAIAVYASVAVEPPRKARAVIAGSVVLLHSPRAARRLAGIVEHRADVRLAALSAAVADAAGAGWEAIAWPARPDDALLAALARGLAE